MDQNWLRLIEACRRSKRSQNQLYRLAALGQVRTRRAADGRLEFKGADLDRISQQQTAEVSAEAG